MASVDLDTTESGNSFSWLWSMLPQLARSPAIHKPGVSSVSGEVRELLYSMRLFPRSECVFWGSFSFEPDLADTMKLRPMA